jgi:hypothetical protein
MPTLQINTGRENKILNDLGSTGADPAASQNAIPVSVFTLLHY